MKALEEALPGLYHLMHRTARRMALIAIIAPSTPTVPSYLPEAGIASQCDPDITTALDEP
jgi:hypothetical protein